MTPEVLSRAFEPYFTTKDVGAGSGLGLSQVYGFASQSGGTAVIASAPGAGAAITLFLPRARADAAGEVEAAPAAVPSSPLKILVVEDEAEIADLTTAMLDDIGYEAIHVPDAGSALAVLAGNREIGLVISDIVMPGAASGLDLARALREDRPELPVLLVTGYSEHHAAVADEAFDLLEKPYRRETLATAVRRALEHGARRARGAGGGPSPC
jgi:two-component system NtrC family sensor kinase